MAEKESTVVDAEVEETNDVELDLENAEISFDDAEDEETEEAEGDDNEAEEESDDEDDVEPEEEDTKEETPEEESPKETQSEKDRKAFNASQAEARIKAKEEAAQREKALKADQDKYISEADPDDPIVKTVRDLEVKQYNMAVTANTNTLTNAFERATKDFDILSDPDPVIQQELADALDSFQARHVVMDTYGNPTEVRGDLYAYLQTKADNISKLRGIGARQQADSKDKEKSKVLTTPVRAPKPSRRDADLDAFDEEANRY